MANNGIHASALSKDTLQGGVYVLQGTDAYWLKQAENLFRSLLPEDSLSLRVIEEVTDVSEIISAFGTLCFSDDRTVVLVRDDNATLDEKSHAALTAFLRTPVAPDFLVFCGVPFLTTAEIKLCNVVSCTPLDKDSCVSFCEKMANGCLDRMNARKICELSAYDMSRIGNEIRKLLAYGEGKPITENDIDLLVTENTETTVFHFSNNIVEGKLELAEKQLDKLLKRGEKPAMLLALLSSQFRKMLYCAITPLDNAEMATLLGMKDFAVEKTRRIKGYSQTKLRSCVDMLTEYEYKFKSGVLSEGTAFSAVVSKLLAKEVII